MNPPDNTNQLMLNITAVERDTRIGKDALRVWEKRYGFPTPKRDINGERLYPPDQVEKLRVIKRLLDAGHRPGRIVSLTLEDLYRLGEELRESDVAKPAAVNVAPEQQNEIQDIITLLKSHDPAQIRRRFSQIIMRTGLSQFVLKVAIPLMHEIGVAWASGELHILKSTYVAKCWKPACVQPWPRPPRLTSTAALAYCCLHSPERATAWAC